MRGSSNATSCSWAFSQDKAFWGDLFPHTHRCNPQLRLSRLFKSYIQHKKHRTQVDKLLVHCLHRTGEGKKACEMALGMLTVSFRGNKTTRWGMLTVSFKTRGQESRTGWCMEEQAGFLSYPTPLPFQAAVILTSPTIVPCFTFLAHPLLAAGTKRGRVSLPAFKPTSIKAQPWNYELPFP